MRAHGLLAAAWAAASLLVPAADAAPEIRYGVQDDAWLAHGPGTLEGRLDELERLGVDVVRFNLRWDVVEAERGQRVWDEPDAVLEGLRSRGIDAVLALVGTPPWASRSGAANAVPARAADFAAFARAAATRYSWVRDWLIWNEPNQRRWLSPASPALYVSRLLNPAYAAIHAVNARARVAGGVTAPRAGTGGVSPVRFIRGLRAAGARLDVYAHHPYPARPSDSPFVGGCRNCETITMATLERLLREVTRAWGTRKRIWLTEYAYQTNPPDRVAGVPQLRQARLLAEAALRAHRAPRVDMLIHYIVVDEPDLARWQSGLYTQAGRPKPAAAAFPLPLTQAGRSGGAAVLWGMVRPRAGAQPYRLQVRRPGESWAWAGGTRTTTARGYVFARLAAPRGTLVRLWSPRDATFGVPLAVR